MMKSWPTSWEQRFGKSPISPMGNLNIYAAGALGLRSSTLMLIVYYSISCMASPTTPYPSSENFGNFDFWAISQNFSTFGHFAVTFTSRECDFRDQREKLL
jgi:hypothetical protein